MIFIYNCFGGTHSSSLASAIHLNKLPSNRVPTNNEILNTDYFNKLSYKDMGRIIYRGTDEEGNKVYSMGRGTSMVLLPCLKNFVKLLHKECSIDQKIILSNMTPTVTPLMTVGGFLSRGVGVDFLGVPLLLKGTKQAYQHIVGLVKMTKEKAKTLNEPVLVLFNN